jgi:hypothetical protein
MPAQLELDFSEEPLDRGEPRCPYCGDTDQACHFGLDAHTDPKTGRIEVSWQPCCYELRDYVEIWGWDQTYGQSLEDCLREVFGWDVREVSLEDGLARFSLRARILEPTERAMVWEAITEHHEHHGPPCQWKFGAGCWNGRALVGVAVVGRPVSRMIQQAEPKTLEVTRECNWGDRRLRFNASSKLYGLCCREARRRGFTKLITYTLESENGASLRASGFKPVARTKGGSWGRVKRPRQDKAPTCRKVRWEREL